MADLRALRTEMRRRTKVIRELGETDATRCPENKVTPELAADKRLGLHPIVIAIDECQVAVRAPGATAARPRRSAPTWPSAARRWASCCMLATQRPDAKSIPTPHQRQRGAADVPEGHGPGRERHGPGHQRLQERDPGHHVQLRRQGRVLLRRRGQGPADRVRLRVRPARLQGDRRPGPGDARARRADHRLRARPGPRRRPGPAPGSTTC